MSYGRKRNGLGVSPRCLKYLAAIACVTVINDSLRNNSGAGSTGSSHQLGSIFHSKRSWSYAKHGRNSVWGPCRGECRGLRAGLGIYLFAYGDERTTQRFTNQAIEAALLFRKYSPDIPLAIATNFNSSDFDIFDYTISLSSQNCRLMKTRLLLRGLHRL